MRPPPAALPAVPGLGNSAAAAGPSAGTTAGASAAGGSGVPASGSLSISVNWGIRLQQEADALSLLKQMALEGHKRLKASRLYSAKISAKAGSSPRFLSFEQRFSRLLRPFICI